MVGTISSQPHAPDSTNPAALGRSTPIPWSSSSAPSRRSEVIRPPRRGLTSIVHRVETNLIGGRIVRRSGPMRVASLVALACLLAACSPNTAKAIPASSPTASIDATPNPWPSPTPLPAPPPEPSHVFLIVMENRSYSQAISTTYIAELAAKFSAATGYHGVSHPSLPNYLAMTSGSTWNIYDDGWHPLPAVGLGIQ